MSNGVKNWRSKLILILFFLQGAAIIGRLVFIQIIDKDLYRAWALGQQKDFEEFSIARGKIFFRDGKNVLATNYFSDFVFVSPLKIKNQAETAGILATLLDLEEEWVLEKIKGGDNLYQELKSDLSKEEIENIEKLKLTGVFLSQKLKRYYPEENIASKVVGFLGGNNEGQYGLEGYYDETLKRGAELVLTLDFNVQFKAEKLLEVARSDLDIEGGQIIVLEPETGKILALADFPNFNPNQYSKVENIDIFQNGITQRLFEPGSIFKPITMAAALNENKITPTTTYQDKGSVKIGEHTIYNFDFKVWGQQTMTNVLENSINTGAVFVEKQLSHAVFLDYIAKFGLFEPAAIDLPEIYSLNEEFKKGYEINFATASFGQGIEMTPIQVVKAMACISNGGKLLKPYIVEKILTEKETIEIEPEIIRDSVISSKTSAQLTAMLVSAVEQGYGKRAKIPGYYIAGKTGTSQISFSSLGIKKAGYSDKTWQTFIGWLPAFNPKFLILVKLDNPKVKMAGLSTTGIARELMKYLIDYHQIPPDHEPH